MFVCLYYTVACIWPVPASASGGKDAATKRVPLKKKEVVSREVKSMQVDDFVIFEYEGELFPGQVVRAKYNGYEIKSMEKSGFNWKWPKIEDKMFYWRKDIKEKISTPKKLKRGVFEVPELKQRWS